MILIKQDTTHIYFNKSYTFNDSYPTDINASLEIENKLTNNKTTFTLTSTNVIENRYFKFAVDFSDLIEGMYDYVLKIEDVEYTRDILVKEITENINTLEYEKPEKNKYTYER